MCCGNITHIILFIILVTLSDEDPHIWWHAYAYPAVIIAWLILKIKRLRFQYLICGVIQNGEGH